MKDIQKLIEEANKQLEQAERRIKTLQSQIGGASSGQVSSNSLNTVNELAGILKTTETAIKEFINHAKTAEGKSADAKGAASANQVEQFLHKAESVKGDMQKLISQAPASIKTAIQRPWQSLSATLEPDVKWVRSHKPQIAKQARGR